MSSALGWESCLCSGGFACAVAGDGCRHGWGAVVQTGPHPRGYQESFGLTSEV